MWLYAAALFNNLLEANRDDHHYTALTSFGSFFHDPCQALAFPHWEKGVKYGPRFVTRKAATLFWNSKSRAGHYLDQFDIVHANNFWCPPWPISGRLIYTLYDMSFFENPEWSTKKNRSGCIEGINRAALYADKFIAISKATKRAFLEHFPDINPNKVNVIYPASRYNQTKERETPKKPRNVPKNINKNFFLSVGTIEPRKNQNFLLKAYEMYRERGNPPVPLIFAGKSGWLMDGFEKRLQSSKWKRDIHLLGYVNEKELAWLYSNCLANLYPSLYEGFGLPVLEGMTFGAYTIASDTTSIPEIIKESGVLICPHKTELWIQALSEVGKSPQKAKKLGNLGLSQASEFGWKKSTDSVISIYNE